VAVEERERAEAAVPHGGADESWAAVLRAMRLGEQPATCGACSVDIHWDQAHEAWVDGQGFAAGADAHPHEPAEPTDERKDT
jgi:hypothetical protein